MFQCVNDERTAFGFLNQIEGKIVCICSTTRSRHPILPYHIAIPFGERNLAHALQCAP